MLQRLVHGFRRTGADVPFGDPLPSHSTEMEGWFWRVTEPSTGRAIVALCSVNRHPEGDWSTTAVALHPGGIVRSAALDGAVATHPPFNVAAGSGALPSRAGAEGVDFQLDDVHLQMEFSDPFVWPKAFGGGGVFSSIPFLNQYWHPYRLGGQATGSVEFEGQSVGLHRRDAVRGAELGRGFSAAVVVGSGARLRRGRRVGGVLRRVCWNSGR